LALAIATGRNPMHSANVSSPRYCMNATRMPRHETYLTKTSTDGRSLQAAIRTVIGSEVEPSKRITESDATPLVDTTTEPCGRNMRAISTASDTRPPRLSERSRTISVAPRACSWAMAACTGIWLRCKDHCELVLHSFRGQKWYTCGAPLHTNCRESPPSTKPSTTTAGM
jgi:hypothetical protein